MNVCKNDASILIIYTGGTIGMIENPETGSLEAFNFEHLEEHVPELKNLGYKISSIRPADGFIGDGAGFMDEDRACHCGTLS